MKIVAVISLLAVVIIGIFFTNNTNHRQEMDRFTQTTRQEEEIVIESFLLDRLNTMKPYPQEYGKYFCDAQIVWEKIINKQEKVVFSHSSCASIVLKDGDLRSEGGGGEPALYKLKNSSGKWQIEDFDDRMVSPLETTNKEWVKQYEKLVPKDIKEGGGINHFSTAGVIDQAASYYKVSVPKYTLSYCSTQKDCKQDEVCVKHGIHSNPGPNTCVKTCTTNKACGIAHTCREQCINGENGCPDNAYPICIPDLYALPLEKNLNEIIR